MRFPVYILLSLWFFSSAPTMSGQEILQLAVFDNTGTTLLHAEQSGTTTFFGGLFDQTFTTGGVIKESRGAEDIFLLSATSEDTLLSVFSSSFDDDLYDVVTSDDGQVYVLGHYWDTLYINDVPVLTTAFGKALFIARSADMINWSVNQIEGSAFKEAVDMEISMFGLAIALNFSDSIFVDAVELVSGIRTSACLLLEPMTLAHLQHYVVTGSGYNRASTVAVNDNEIVIGGSFQGVIHVFPDSIRTNTLDEDGYVIRLVTNDLVPDQLYKVGGVFEDAIRSIIYRNDTLIIGGDFIGRVAVNGDSAMESQGFERDIFLYYLLEGEGILKTERIGGTGDEVLDFIGLTDDDIWVAGRFTESFEWNGSVFNPNTGRHAFVFHKSSSMPWRLIANETGVGDTRFYDLCEYQDSVYVMTGIYRGVGEMGAEWKLPSTTQNRSFLLTLGYLPDQPDVSDGELLLYPNPVSDVLYWTASDEVESIAFYSVDGRRVRLPQESASFVVGDLPAGVYMMSVEMKNGRIVVRPFVKL